MHRITMHSHLIAEKLGHCLMQRKSKNRACIQGISDISTKTQHTVLLHFIPRYNDRHIILDAATLFDILSMKQGTKTDTVKWNIPRMYN